MSNNDVIKQGRHLAFLLRHDKEGFEKGLIDKNGWRKVDELIKSHQYTKELLEEIVETNDKQRYEFNNDKTKIRARQGHSIDVDVELKEETPPDILYHGTSSKFLESIYKQGILKGVRQYVHLSSDIETAKKVGSRHGNPVVLFIDTKKMKEDGIKFFKSNNNVWLTDYIDKKYINKESYE
jgi:putative RNA 2'-phosphotransferase